jgi:hypothetical protein
VVTNGTADTDLAPSADSRLVDVNLDPPFPNAPGFRAVGLLADEAGAGGLVAAADHATHGDLMAMIRDQSPPGR